MLRRHRPGWRSSSLCPAFSARRPVGRVARGGRGGGNSEHPRTASIRRAFARSMEAFSISLVSGIGGLMKLGGGGLVRRRATLDCPKCPVRMSGIPAVPFRPRFPTVFDRLLIVPGGSGRFWTSAGPAGLPRDTSEVDRPPGGRRRGEHALLHPGPDARDPSELSPREERGRGRVFGAVVRRS